MFCFACTLFGGSDQKSVLTAGYSDWKNATTRLAEAGCINSELKKLFDNECEYWTEVLKRVVLSRARTTFQGTQ